MYTSHLISTTLMIIRGCSDILYKPPPLGALDFLDFRYNYNYCFEHCYIVQPWLHVWEM